MSNPLIEINNLKKHFHVGSGQILKAVDGINLKVKKKKLDMSQYSMELKKS